MTRREGGEIKRLKKRNEETRQKNSRTGEERQEIYTNKAEF